MFLDETSVIGLKLKVRGVLEWNHICACNFDAGQTAMMDKMSLLKVKRMF